MGAGPALSTLTRTGRPCSNEPLTRATVRYAPDSLASLYATLPWRWSLAVSPHPYWPQPPHLLPADADRRVLRAGLCSSTVRTCIRVGPAPSTLSHSVTLPQSVTPLPPRAACTLVHLYARPVTATSCMHAIGNRYILWCCPNLPLTIYFQCLTDMMTATEDTMKLRRDQQRWIDHLREHGTPRGMTLGRGRPHDRRILQGLINAYLVKPLLGRSEPLQDEYAVRGDEDEHGLALLVTQRGEVTGATHYGVRIRPFSDEDYNRDASGSCLQNGADTAWGKYPDDEIRREWMQWAVARSTLAMYD